MTQRGGTTRREFGVTYAAIEHMVAEEGLASVYGEEPEAFLAWARARANRIDPLAAAPGSTLDKKDKWSRGWYW